MLTLKDLKSYPKFFIFKQGETEEFRFAAVRGGHWDWAVYTGSRDKSYEYIAENGDKLRIIDELAIRDLVPCTEAALRQYRH